ncbi:porin family protein [Tenacibaculum halocynthiae]|uniref:porin family protein n=1 Tax=Tenacibaculum halocynthiae TaxID=1254437 RepID=UPI003894D0CA
MKKLLVIAMVALGFTAKAQDIDFGVKAGVNFANLTGDIPDNSSVRTSFHVGGVVEFKITDKFSIQPELLYSAQGMKYEREQGGVNFEFTTKVDYLYLPVMAKYYVIDNFSIEAGPQLGFLLSAKTKAEAASVSNTQDFKENAEDMDFGLNFGLGYKLNNGLNFGVRYNLGLSNLAKENGTDIKNGVFQVSVGYNF